MKQVILIILSLLSFQFAKAQISDEELSKFSSDEVRAFVKEYDEYLVAVKNNNTEQIQKITESDQGMATKVQQIAVKMTPDDAKIFAEYAQKIAKRIQETFSKDDVELGSATLEEIPEKGSHTRQ